MSADWGIIKAEASRCRCWRSSWNIPAHRGGRAHGCACQANVTQAATLEAAQGTEHVDWAPCDSRAVQRRPLNCRVLLPGLLMPPPAATSPSSHQSARSARRSGPRAAQQVEKMHWQGAAVSTCGSSKCAAGACYHCPYCRLLLVSQQPCPRNKTHPCPPA